MTTDRFIPYAQLAQWKAAVKMEGLGMKHSSGRSVTQLVRNTFGLSRKVPRTEIIAMLERYMAELLARAGEGTKEVLKVSADGTDSKAIDYNKEQSNAAKH